MSAIVKICNSIIEYSFLAILFFVPFVFSSTTSELFEFNKMWITYGLALLIAGSWITKMILKKQFYVKTTRFDWFLLAFVASQVISTLFSLDMRVSWWGFYSRFNGGLLSTLTYVFLYYALVTHVANDSLEQNNPNNKTPFGARITLFTVAALLIPFGALLAAPPVSKPQDALTWIFWACVIISFFLFTFSLSKQFLKRILSMTFISAGIVALWGLPSHFASDPTCYLFRGVMDVACWTDAFQPRVRMFSTIGQPAWLGAYLAALIPVAVALLITNYSKQRKILDVKNVGYLAFTLLLLTDLVFTRTRASVVALFFGMLYFFVFFFFIKILNSKYKLKISAIVSAAFILVLFFTDVSSIPLLNKINFSSFFNKQQPTAGKYFDQKAIQPKPVPEEENKKIPALEGGGTESGTIRLYVWKGALNAWKHNILFGTGVETFGFAYNQYKPVEHNLTSEWDYLYNKAHNEYLNYLTTTGIVGLASYILYIGAFLFFCTFSVLKDPTSTDNKLNSKKLLLLGLGGGYITILITNFFGFSVVIINLFIFLYPAFALFLEEEIFSKKAFVFPKMSTTSNYKIGTGQILILITLWSLVLFYLYSLYTFWESDRAYALGYNYNRIGSYQIAYPSLKKAVEMNSEEPTFKDELSLNNAALALEAAQKQDKETAAKFARSAIEASDNVLTNHPNSVLFWKTRVRILSSLAQLNPDVYQAAITSALKARSLAPTDAKITYSLGILYAQTNQIDKALDMLKETVRLKSNYRDAYYALGLMYHAKAIDSKGKVKDQQMQNKAADTMRYILKNISPKDTQVKDALKEWGQPIE